jgi:aminoglycoside 6-adenylyltransferase
MRSEQEMFELIVETAESDSRIRAVILNGSRTNPIVPQDTFQDYDIVYLVTQVNSFKDDPAWVDRFGETMIVQMPDAMQDSHAHRNGSFSYLMQFTDGNRIDLNLFPLARLDELEKDSLSLLLLDKDGLIKPFAPPDDSDYLPVPPTAETFHDCCNEFWWVCPYVAKGLWREELLYAKFMFEQVVRGQLMTMLVWYMGVKTHFTRNPGKQGKYLKHYLEPELWLMLEKTYSDASFENIWESLEIMCDLFRVTANRVAEHYDFDYPQDDDDKVSAHLHHVRSLPGNATEMY